MTLRRFTDDGSARPKMHVGAVLIDKENTISDVLERADYTLYLVVDVMDEGDVVLMRLSDTIYGPAGSTSTFKDRWFKRLEDVSW